MSNLHSALETSAHSRCPSSTDRRAAKDRFRNLMFPPTRANFPALNANVRRWFSLTREGAGSSTNRKSSHLSLVRARENPDRVSTAVIIVTRKDDHHLQHHSSATVPA